MRTRVCRHCGSHLLTNKKLKHLTQYYCGRRQCQRARKLAFDRKKYRENSSFRLKKLNQAKERKSRGENVLLGSAYQRSYRESHPGYELENRLKQKQRNAKRRRKKSEGTKIVNPDTFMSKPSDNKQVYAMIAVDYEKIVNPDTLMPQLNDIMSVATAQMMFVRRL